MADIATPRANRSAARSEATRTIRMRRRLTASPERVFRAFSDPEELARWLPDRVEGGLAVGSRTILVWPRRRLWWEVLESTPSRRFLFRWPWDDADRLVTTVTIDVTPSGYGTLLDLEDGPFPVNSPEGLDAWAAGLEGWGEALAMLRAHLDFSVDLRPLV